MASKPNSRSNPISTSVNVSPVENKSQKNTVKDETGVSIEMSLSRDQSPTVEVTGKEDAVKNARSNVMTRLETQAKLVSERLPVEKIYHPFVCGPNNAIIERLMDETGARINVPPFRVQKDEIIVSGEKDDVIWCKATIMRIYQEKKRKCQTMSFEVRKSQHKYVIGPHGNNLQEILANTGVSVEVPLLDSPSETITLRGEQEQLGLALKMVHSKANNVIYADVNAPNWLHRFIIGNKGENIRRITQVCPKCCIGYTPISSADKKLNVKSDILYYKTRTARQCLSFF